MDRIGFRYAVPGDAQRIVKLLGSDAHQGLPLIVAYLDQRVIGAASAQSAAVDRFYRGYGIEKKMQDLVDEIVARSNA